MNDKSKSVYMTFGTDIIHGGHVQIINKAAELGELTIGVLTNEVIASYKRYPLIDVCERAEILSNLKGVNKVVIQDSILGESVLRDLKPDYLVHGDDWVTGFKRPFRDKTIEIMKEWGGFVVEFPYSESVVHDNLEKSARAQLSIPDMRRGLLKKLLVMKGLVTAIEAHSGLTGIIAEETKVVKKGKVRQFDAMWVSSLCDSTLKGKPDIELVDFTSRLRTLDDIMEVTTKPIIFDGDTGGLVEHFAYMVKTLERIGISAIIIEDKIGLKKNSLFGTQAEQEQDTIENFCKKITEGKSALKTRDMLIIARIESLILEVGMDDALKRAHAYVEAGADAIMIHSRRKTPDEILEFCRIFRSKNKTTPIVAIPSTYSTVTEEELAEAGVNIVIYANQLMRSAFPAMQNTAKSILENHRAKEAEVNLMSIKDIITLIR